MPLEKDVRIKSKQNAPSRSSARTVVFKLHRKRNEHGNERKRDCCIRIKKDDSHGNVCVNPSTLSFESSALEKVRWSKTSLRSDDRQKLDACSNDFFASGDLCSFYKYPKQREKEKIKESNIFLPITPDKKIRYKSPEWTEQGRDALRHSDLEQWFCMANRCEISKKTIREREREIGSTRTWK